MTNLKLKKIVEEITAHGFKTTQTSVNPDTGKISWDVEYFPDFSSVLEHLDSSISELQKIIKQEALTDEVFLQSLKVLKSAKSIMLKRLKQQYPDYIKDYQG